MKRKIITFLLKIYTAPLNAALKKTGTNHQKALIIELFKRLYSSNEYCMMSFFPKILSDKNIKGTNNDFGNVAIVMQGPIAETDDFTINTIKIYKQYYDNVRIIVSTWIDCDQKVIEQIEGLGAYVVLNEYPEYHGNGNINYQIVNSFSGMKKAKELGVKYVWKTRTDQRFYNPCGLSLLQGVYQEDKIILLGGIANSFYSRCFYISDFSAFGSIENMSMLYDCKLCTEEAKKTLEENKSSMRFEKFIEYVNHAEADCNVVIPDEYDDSNIRYECPEIFIAYQYYCKKNDPEKISSVKKAYDDFLKNQVVIVNADSLGFYWLKYDHQIYRQTWFDRLGKLDEGKWHSILEEQKKV